jgi:hypothetical protein
MPRYRVRLEDPNSDEFRVTVLSAKDRNEAQRIAEAREAQFVAKQYTDEELKIADDAGNRGARVIHDQTEPYKVVAVAKRGEKFERSN